MPQDIDDKELVERLNSRDEAAIEAAFHKFYAALCYFCNKITRDPEASKDIVQEVFTKLFEKRHYRHENMIALKTFLFNSVRNGAVDHIRLQIRSNKSLINSQISQAVSEADLEFFELESDVITKVFEAIELLPESCRTIFKMSYLDRRSIRDIALELHISENTVKTQRQRAKHHLRDWLNDLYSVLSFLLL